MIITLILNALRGLLFGVFSWINIPGFPDDIMNGVNNFLDIIFGNLSLLGFFIRPVTLSIVIPILILLLNFEEVYKFVMWILKKIPVLNIK